jgi:hypothetical protein
MSMKVRAEGLSDNEWTHGKLWLVRIEHRLRPAGPGPGADHAP